MAVCQNLVPLVNIKIAGKWMFIPLKMVLIGIDPYPYSKKRVRSGSLEQQPIVNPKGEKTGIICVAHVVAIHLDTALEWPVVSE